MRVLHMLDVGVPFWLDGVHSTHSDSTPNSDVGDYQLQGRVVTFCNSLLGFNSFARAAHGTQTFYVLDEQFIIKGSNWGTARWKRCRGQGNGQGHRASMPSPGATLPAPPRVHQPRSSPSPNFLGFYRSFMTQT